MIRKIEISLEEMVNSLKDRHHLSREQTKEIYKEWGNLREEDIINFDDKGNITSFTPYKAMEKIDIRLKIDPETGEVDIV
ncbi:MAG: hypothetical protein IJH34_05920 [Romboutsia sp.]|nr:hypothetical protein [Romboutsia sp.]